MTKREAIEILKQVREDYEGNGNVLADGKEALDLAIKALKILDDANYKIYRNESCDRAGKCDDYIGWHCTGCNGAKEENHD